MTDVLRQHPIRACLIGPLVAAGVAAADPITDRDYAIDFYDGVAIGDTSQVGMGGAGAARLIGSAGTLLNPSAPAVRRTTDQDGWSWDYHLDFLTGRFSSDYDNNGIVAPEGSGASFFTSGLSLRIGAWAGAITVTGQTTPLAGSTLPELEAEALRTRFALARYIDEIDLAVGIGVQLVQFQIAPVDQDALFAITGGGVLVGATWLPARQRFRLAAAFDGEIRGGDVVSARCDPESCEGYILPSHVESAGRVILGGAYRWGPTAWNQQVATRWRDERSLTVAADLVVTGTAPRGHGLEAFGMQQLQPSGRSLAVSLRGGAELEWLPGRLRVRAGSYWEPARFEEVGGRLHATVGADLRLFAFRAWGPRRGRISVTGDVARQYRNLAVSIGLWN